MQQANTANIPKEASFQLLVLILKIIRMRILRVFSMMQLSLSKRQLPREGRCLFIAPMAYPDLLPWLLLF